MKVPGEQRFRNVIETRDGINFDFWGFDGLASQRILRIHNHPVNVDVKHVRESQENTC